jgi:hypothetical protein
MPDRSYGADRLKNLPLTDASLIDGGRRRTAADVGIPRVLDKLSKSPLDPLRRTSL